jgi:hypothetical protein
VALRFTHWSGRSEVVQSFYHVPDNSHNNWRDYLFRGILCSCDEKTQPLEHPVAPNGWSHYVLGMSE